jgi:hypothetical protein
MQATLPVRTWNITSMALVALLLATIVVFGVAVAFGVSRPLSTAIDQPAPQTIEQSIVNRATDDRALGAPAKAPASVDPTSDDKVGTRNQVEAPLRIDPGAVGAGARGRMVSVPQ